MDIKNISEKEHVPHFVNMFSQIDSFLKTKGHNYPEIVNTLDLERYQLLFEAVNLYKQSNYYGTAPLLRCFIEKFIREILTLKKFKETANFDDDSTKIFDLSTSIEKEFETANIEDEELITLFDEIKKHPSYQTFSQKQKDKIAGLKNNTWSYNNMIKTMLNEQMINEGEYQYLKITYRDYRNVVQHGVFQRMYTNLLDQGYFKDLQTKYGGKLKTFGLRDWKVEEHIEIPLESEFLRAKNLFESFQIVSQISFSMCYFLLQKFEDKFNT